MSFITPVVPKTSFLGIEEKEIKTQQNLAAYLMRHMSVEHGVDMRLAGGAPRNWYFDRPANDLDFYIEAAPTKQLIQALSEAGVRVGRHIDLEKLRDVGTKGCSYQTCDSVTDIFYGTFCDIPLQLIFTVNFDRLINKEFSTNLCKIWQLYSTRNGGVVQQSTSDFKQGVEDKTLVFIEGYTLENRHVRKMISYFPDYKYEVKGEEQ